MGAALEDRRFVTYLVVSNIALVVLAFLGPIWCVAGLSAFAAVEIASVMRRRPEPARVRRR